MRRLLERALPRGRLARRFAVLAGGTLLGQLITTAGYPLITRLFTPAEFGAYAVFTSLSGILGGAALLRYEQAVQASRVEREAAGLAALAALSAVAVAAATVPAVWLAGPRLARAVGMPDLAGVFWLLPLAVLAAGLSQTLSAWAFQLGDFRADSLGRIAQAAVQLLAQALLGALALGASGLVAGYAVAYLSRFLFGLPRALRRFRPGPRAELAALAREHWRYPAYAAPSAVLQSATQLAPPILLAIVYDPSVAGLFGLGQRLMSLPVRLLSQSASQVFLSEVAHAPPEAAYRLFVKTSLRFLALGAAGVIVSLLAAPALFEFAFGAAWREAGEMVRLLVPLYLARFVVTPVAQILNLVGRQDLHLASALLGLLGLVLSLGAGWLLRLPPSATVLLYSLASTAALLFYFAAAWRLARRAARGGAV